MHHCRGVWEGGSLAMVAIGLSMLTCLSMTRTTILLTADGLRHISCVHDFAYDRCWAGPSAVDYRDLSPLGGKFLKLG